MAAGPRGTSGPRSSSAGRFFDMVAVEGIGVVLADDFATEGDLFAGALTLIAAGAAGGITAGITL